MPLRPSLLPRLFVVLCLLYFWANGIASLDRFPRIHEDETWIAAPGIHFWSSEGFGTFGTPLFAGFYGMEERYYGFMPLFPLLTGLSVRLFGMGLLQIRLVALFASLLTLALTYRLGTMMFSRWHGVLAVLILVGWKIAVPSLYFATGIPLADMARLTRYDNLVPVFGLAASVLIRSRPRMFPLSPPRPRSHNQVPARERGLGGEVCAGVCVGLAALSHVYGAFWLVPLLVIRRSVALCIGFSIALLPYALYIAADPQAFLHQQANNSGRFQLTSIDFYQQNLLNEIQRYQPIIDALHDSFGAWLWLAGTAVGIGVLLARRERTLLWALLIQGVLFALLLKPKTPMYLTTLLPLFALVIAAAWVHSWRSKWARPVLVVVFALALAEGAVSTYHTRLQAAQTTPYAAFTDAIARQILAGSRVVAMQHYWLGLVDDVSDYRSILVPMWQANPQFVAQPMAFNEAMAQIAPNIVLVDEVLLNFFAAARVPGHPYRAQAREMRAYISSGTLLAIVNDATYGRVLVYQFEPP